MMMSDNYFWGLHFLMCLRTGFRPASVHHIRLVF